MNEERLRSIKREAALARQRVQHQPEGEFFPKAVAIRSLLFIDLPDLVRVVREQATALQAAERERVRQRTLLDNLTVAARRVVKCEYDDFHDALEELETAFYAAELAPTGATTPTQEG